jgi:general stress protein 26
MNSINKEQLEENHQNLLGAEAIRKIKQLGEKAKICFFCTKINTSQSFSIRPMTLQEVDHEGNLWFLSASDSKLNREINADNHAQLLFQGSDFSDFLDIYGTVTITTDKEIIKKLWKPLFKDWFTEGENDPRITVLKIKPEDGYYWDTKNGEMVSFIKTIAGAIMGKTLDDSIEGTITL